MDFKFIENPTSKKWTIYSPRRSKRPDESKGSIAFCPFCPGKESLEKESYRVGGKDENSNWDIRVIPNKFPFAPIHEVVIHSRDHHKNFDELPLFQNELILETYKQRFISHSDKGQVCIFHNHGEAAGESIPHPHSQIAVIPDNVELEVPLLDLRKEDEYYESDYFKIYAPISSQWPDEIWVVPNRIGNYYMDITQDEIKNLAFVLYRLIQIFDIRHGSEFPFNFYISPKKEWYLRIIPRQKTAGGFEVATGVWVNTQDPKETIRFVKEHFKEPNEAVIREKHEAQYHTKV